ncbi:hypothetical protein LZD49_30890 [Dyadobacter sp. CY261]|nr:hypothetical protein [Dyadobacter sp. CY261]
MKSYNGNRYTLEYAADNKLDKLNEAVFNIPGSGSPSGYRPIWRFQYENGYLRRILNELKDYPEAAGEEAYTRIKFDYGPQGIEKVYFYTTGYVDYRFDYTYDNFDRPTSMIHYTYSLDDPNQYPHGSRTPKAVFKYQYEYDKNGNIVREYGTSLVPSENHWDYVASFNYDNSANSIKLLETFRFSSRSAPWIFSANNLVDGEYLFFNDSPVPKEISPTLFDSEKNIINTYSTYGLKWDCN